MPEPLKHEQIAGSVWTHWSAQFPLAAVTIYPGTKVDTADLSEWLELRIDAWSQPPQRATADQLLELAVTVECFVKQGLDKSRLHELADAARSTLSGQTVPVRDYDSSGTPVTGYVTFREPETRDLSRNDVNTLQHAMQHFRMVIPGIAQQV